ncbi:MAG: endolytic transglycosylase MltG [Clostridium sp.]|nr:endolytic transglycosylase MltG [Clostridium sp.]
MKRKVFNVKKFIVFIFVLCVIVLGILVGSYFYIVNSHGKSSDTVSIVINSGDTYNTIADKLKREGLIKSTLCYKIYIKLNKPKDLTYGKYELKKSYNLSELINAFEKGGQNNSETKKITFVEGKNMRYVISKLIENFSFSEKKILTKLSDSSYLDTLINKYWFLTDEIKNKDIYYSLEGYLYPDTYEFYSTASLEDIFRSMLDNMDKKLTPYKSEIETSNYTVHQMLTLASIVELEAGTSNDRKGVSGVFYNRLNNKWSLGSDVTTYYAEKLDNWSVDLKVSQLNKCNAYNTRSTCMNGKLPVSPVCNPGIDSIVASIEPTKHKYYYFVADKNGKTYFNETDSGHIKTVNKLKSEGLWIEYQN